MRRHDERVDTVRTSHRCTAPQLLETPLLRNPIGFLLIPGFTVIALASAIEPLRIANRYLHEPYRWTLLSPDGEAVADANGICIQPHRALAGSGPLGTLIICADVRPERCCTRELRTRLHALDRSHTTLGALDTAVLLLARANLLDGTRVTMHWEMIGTFRERFPHIEVFQTLFEVGLRLLTCAGGTAALDMMLNAIAADHDLSLANRVAEHCLHEHIRSGGESQRMALPLRIRIHHKRLADAVQLLEATLDRQVPLDTLARQTGLSVRQLLRLFKEHLDEGPAQYHRRLRIEHARTLLRNSALTVTEASVAVGFESAAHFCRAYRVQYGRSPGQDRNLERSGRQPLRDLG